MSWSFHATGKPAAVAEKAETVLSGIKCAEPEETIKGLVAEIIAESLAVFPDTHAVTVAASGSQSVDSTAPGIAVNTLSVEIRPIYGFVE